MMGYTLRYQTELRSQSGYFRDIREQRINAESLEMAEALIAKRAATFDPSKFEDGYEIAVKELVDAKLKHLPVPKDEAPRVSHGKVVNLMDALRESLGEKSKGRKAPPKKPGVSTKEPAATKGIRLVKASARNPRRKSA